MRYIPSGCRSVGYSRTTSEGKKRRPSCPGLDGIDERRQLPLILLRDLAEATQAHQRVLQPPAVLPTWIKPGVEVLLNELLGEGAVVVERPRERLDIDLIDLEPCGAHLVRPPLPTGKRSHAGYLSVAYSHSGPNATGAAPRRNRARAVVPAVLAVGSGYTIARRGRPRTAKPKR